MKRVSIIMPVYNQNEELDLTLAAFTLQDYSNFEIVVINDGGNRDVEKIINKYNNCIEIVYEYQDNHGRAIARNECLKRAAGEIIIFCDADRIPSKSFISTHVAALSKNKKMVTIGEKQEIVTFFKESLNVGHRKIMKAIKQSSFLKDKIIDQNCSNLITAEDIIKNFEDVIENTCIGVSYDNNSAVFERWGNDLHNFQFGWGVATTANLGYDRTQFDKVFFDQIYHGWGMEDTDFSYQLYRQGCDFEYLPSAVNYHQLHERKNEIWAQLEDNVRYFCYKYPTIETALFAGVIKELITLNDVGQLYNEYKNDNVKWINVIENLCKYVAVH